MKDIYFKTIMLKGEAGGTIRSIEKTGTSGNVDTYTITLNDGSTFNFQVTNGSNIASIAKTGSHDNIDVYTITLTNGDTFPFEVKNGNVVNTLEPSAGIDRTSNAPSVDATNGGLSAVESAAKGYTDSSIGAEDTALKGYCDSAVGNATTNLQNYADGKLTAANTYSDGKNTELEAAIKNVIVDKASFFTTAGVLATSGTDSNFEAHGVAYWQAIGTKAYRVDFEAKVSRAGTIANNYDYGFTAASLLGSSSSFEILTIDANSAGSIEIFDENGVKDPLLNGYGAGLVFAGDNLVPARKLNADGNPPSSATMWACAALPLGTTIKGFCYVWRG